jgi:hypothetical protein
LGDNPQRGIYLFDDSITISRPEFFEALAAEWLKRVKTEWRM